MRKLLHLPKKDSTICTALNSVSPKFMSHPEPQDVTLFGNRIIVGIIKIRSHWIKMGPKSNDWCPYKRSRHTKIQAQREERGICPPNGS